MKIKTITYLLLISTFFYGCSKCVETTAAVKKVPYYEIPDLFPYNEIQTLRFLKNKTDTLIFNNLGMKTIYNYSITEETECKPQKTPLEYKYMQFIDSVSKNNFVLSYYINYSFYDNFSITINDRNYVNGSPLGFGLKEPIVSVNVLGKQYDTVANIISVFKDSLTFKTGRYGLLKFTSNGNLFELIP